MPVGNLTRRRAALEHTEGCQAQLADLHAHTFCAKSRSRRGDEALYRRGRCAEADVPRTDPSDGYAEATQ